MDYYQKRVNYCTIKCAISLKKVVLQEIHKIQCLLGVKLIDPCAADLRSLMSQIFRVNASLFISWPVYFYSVLLPEFLEHSTPDTIKILTELCYCNLRGEVGLLKRFAEFSQIFMILRYELITARTKGDMKSNVPKEREILIENLSLLFHYIKIEADESKEDFLL